jgi:ClpP class serine protease
MKVFWAMKAEELERFYAFREAEARVRGEAPAELIKEIKAEALEWGKAEKSLYKTENGIADIGITGTLEARRSVSSSLYGETTTYTEIEEAVLAAERDPLVEKIRFSINSPGGSWDGVDFCAETIKKAGKPTEAVIYTAAHSAGYYLASQAGKIYAATKGSAAGSIGVAAEFFDRTMEDEKRGIKRYVFTNTESADKRPNAAESEGAAVIQEELDGYYRIFENRVVEGRQKNVPGFTAENIRRLRGRSVLAEKAFEIGLIDGILSEMPENEPGNRERLHNTFTGGINMKLADFLAANAEAKAEVDTLVLEQATAMTEKLEADTVKNAVVAERGRILDIFSLSGAKLSDETKKAVETGADAGEYAKARLRSVNERAGASNAGALGNPKPETHDVGAGLQAGNGEVSLSAEEIKAIGRMAGGKK